MDERTMTPFGTGGYASQPVSTAYGGQPSAVPPFMPQQQTTDYTNPPPVEETVIIATPREENTVLEDDDFSFEGYQVVRKEFFSHKFDPQLTIKDNSITFNNACILKLEKVVYIQFLINPETKQLVIRPCAEDAKDAVRWCVVKEDKRKSREITCAMFMAKLRDMMGWKPVYRYKMMGTIKQKYGQQFFLFNLPTPEIYLPQTKNGDAAKPRRNLPYFPTSWRDSFGLPLSEHDQSTEFDLSKGFETVGINEADFFAEPAMALEGM